MSRIVLLVAPVLLLVPAAPAAAGPVTPQEIDAAIKKGAGFLKGVYKDTLPDDGHGLGAPALGGLALLEADVPATDPAVRKIAEAVRKQAVEETKTYQLALFLLFLDRLKDPADEPLIQLLAVRLTAGQTSDGGWSYDSIDQVPDAVPERLRANLRAPLAPGAWAPGTLHPEVAAYAKSLKRSAMATGSDNSNTQFAILAVWIARRHGVPVDTTLARIEQRFRTTQNSDGGWPYSGQGAGSPSMTCVGLLGLATAVARRDERLVVAPKPAAPPAPPKKTGPKPDDPFFDPPAKADKGPKKAPPPKREPDVRDLAIARGLAALGAHLAAQVRTTGGRVFPVGEDTGHGVRDLYFLWSLERVGVVYGLEKIGGVDWYDAGAAGITRTQKPNGSWEVSGFGEEANTAMALLFLCKSNVVRDLTTAVHKKGKEPDAPPAAATGPAADAKATELATGLLDAPAGEWAKALAKLRDAAGPEHTRALVLAIGRLDGDRRKQAREALAERLARMTADTLRGMLRADDPELRRAAALACAMKADKAHIPDLIDRLTDDEEFVVRAARAGLKSLTGQDHGPEPGATKEQRKAAADRWRAATKGK